MDYKAFAQNILNHQIDTSNQEAEIYVMSGKETQINVRRGEVEKLSFAGSKGIGIRIIRDGRTGYAYTSDFEPSNVQNTIKVAESLAAISDSDQHRKLPEQQEISVQELEIYDPTIAEKSIEEKIKF
ncbi:MAG: DNA gyrase modulator, partial [Chloroflexota bacterium]